MADTEKTLPKVTVIVPVYNSEVFVSRLVDCLLSQTYPSKLVDIIIVDNKSTDRTVQVLSAMPLTLLHQRSKQSSYAARNLGIEKAESPILAFTDADCTPSPEWLEEGMRTLIESDCDMASGPVRFEFSKKRTAAELYDSITHFRNQDKINEGKGAATCNLFVKRELFDQLGLFPEVKSGGDFQWTGSAINKGKKLVFAEKAFVCHPTRRFLQLLAKSFRTGSGDPYNRLSRGFTVVHEICYAYYRLLPVKLELRKLSEKINALGGEFKAKKWRIIFTALCCRMVSRLAAAIEMTKMILTGKAKRESAKH